MVRSTTRLIIARFASPALALSALMAGSAFASGGLTAQEGDWEVESELGASVYFGNTSQTTFNSRLSTSRADSVFDLSTQTRFNYGEAEDESGVAFVVKRSWSAAANLAWRPFARFSPFAFGQGASSFERRIDFRYNVGGGGRYTYVRSETSRLDFSIGVLAEQTFVRPDPDQVREPDESVLARLSVEMKGRRELNEGRVVLTTESSYRPVVGEYGNYVIESQSGISYALSEIISLKFSFLDTYDSRAEERGADTNNDGQILFSVLSTF